MSERSLLYQTLLCLLIFLLFCCNHNALKENRTSNNYPNGGSELAWLMRDATDQMEIQRAVVLKGEPFQKYSINMDHILTATPTEEGKTASMAYQEKAKQFIVHLQKKDTIPLQGQMKFFNETVAQCVNCHESQCPGPNVRIKKLYIN